MPPFLFGQQTCTTVLSLIALLPSALGCLITFDTLPPCAAACATHAYQSTGVCTTVSCNDLTLNQCLCGSATFNSASGQCLLSECGTAEYELAASAYEEFCASLGIPVALPNPSGQGSGTSITPAASMIAAGMTQTVISQTTATEYILSSLSQTTATIVAGIVTSTAAANAVQIGAGGCSLCGLLLLVNAFLF